jgi:hypothetical protein
VYGWKAGEQAAVRSNHKNLFEKWRYFTIYRDILRMKRQPGCHARIVRCGGSAG